MTSTTSTTNKVTGTSSPPPSPLCSPFDFGDSTSSTPQLCGIEFSLINPFGSSDSSNNNDNVTKTANKKKKKKTPTKKKKKMSTSTDVDEEKKIPTESDVAEEENGDDDDDDDDNEDKEKEDDDFDLDKALDDLEIPSEDDEDDDGDDDDDDKVKDEKKEESIGLFGALRMSIAPRKSSKSDNDKVEETGNDGSSTPPPTTQPDKRKSHFAATGQPFSEREEAAVSAWNHRLQRDEVFSLRYRPHPDEEEDELQDLARHLGLGRSATSSTVAAGTPLSPLSPSKWDVVKATLSGGGPDYTCLTQLVTPDASLQQPQSIVLKRGPVLLKTGKGGDETSDCELVLMTHGFIVLNIEADQDKDLGSIVSNIMGMNKKNPYELSKLWTMVDHVEDTTQTLCTFTLGLKNTNPNSKEPEQHIDFVVLSNSAKDAWIAALERILVQHALHDPNRKSMTESLGWQYQLVHTPGFTAAVTGQVEYLKDPIRPVKPEQLNQLDTHHQYAPLHYAIQQDPCNEQVIQSLLEAGANPNLPDGEDRTPMYYATRNELDQSILDLLQGHGGQASKLAEVEARGELFGGVADAEAKTSKRRSQEQATKDAKAAEVAAKAETAQSAMGDAMNALVQRGEKINEMGDKATELNEGAKDYGDMAKQLKDSLKKKKWYQL